MTLIDPVYPYVKVLLLPTISETMGNRELSAFPDYVNMELAFSCGKFGI